MKHLILGTAGHIDHGKTSLVKALTGIDTDRLKEEKERGITIELGFAHMDLPGDIRLGIVDVPGHERFVRSMVAGVGGMDLVVLVIAADEGVMPQTREHLEICQLLGVKTGMVALTKSDMVDEEWLAMLTEEVRDYLSGTFLEGARIVPVSSRTGQGIEDLRTALTELAATVVEKGAEGPFRLPVDRVFTMTGFGTVVTGTLISGEIRVGDEVEILPSGINSRVRGIQTHGSKEESGVAGQRVAVNLQGVEHTEIERGTVVVPRALFRTTMRVDARLDYLASAPLALKHRQVLRLHSATYEVPAQVILLDRDILVTGASAFVQLRMRSPVLLLPGDPFVLRISSPSTTVGGGKVLDPAPPRRRRRSDAAIELLNALNEGSDMDKVRLLVTGSLYSGITREEIILRSGLTEKRVDTALTPLLSCGEAVMALRDPKMFVSREGFVGLKTTLLSGIEGYLAMNSLKEGMGKEELKGRLPKRSDPRFFGNVLAAMEKDGSVVVERDMVRIPGRTRVTEEDQAALREKVGRMLIKGGIEPPTLKEVCEGTGKDEKTVLEHLGSLAREGRVVKVKAELYYAAEPLASIREKLISHLKEKGEITPGEFRELTGLSRKFMIPLLEHFDQEKLTIRVGEKRVLRRK